MSMQHQLDHVAILVRDLREATAAWEALGFEVQEGGRHIGRGTANAIVRFGLDYLELMAVVDEAEARQAFRDELLNFVERWPGGIIGFVFTTRDIEGDEEQLTTAGVPFTRLPGGKRYRPDGSLLSWRSLVLKGSWWRCPWPLISQFDQPDEERMSHEREGQHPNGARRLQRVDLIVRDLPATIGLYRDRFGLPLLAQEAVPDLGADSARFALGASEIVLLAPSGPGIVADTLAKQGEGPFQVAIKSDRLEQVRGAGLPAAPAPGDPDGLLLDPDRAFGVRMVLIP